jgi:cell migration-inducing and hyaluronan-binding protein
VRAGTEIQVKTERSQVSLNMSEMDEGSWVIFELPGFASAASGTELGSMAALRAATETSYFNDGESIWVKLVADAPNAPVRPFDFQAMITVSKEGLGG